MIKLKHTRVDEYLAYRLGTELGNLNKSITKGAGNNAGYLSEIVLSNFLGIEYNPSHSDLHNHDIEYKGFKIEVKTKRTIHKCRPEFCMTVNEISNHQQPDYFFFVLITFNDRKKINGSYVYYGVNEITFCGYYEADLFYKEAEFKPAGTFNPYNKTANKEAMYEMKVKDLKTFKIT